MEIRDASTSDIQAYHDIYTHYVKTSVATLQLNLPTLEETERKFNYLISQGQPFVVALINNQVAGFAYSDAFNERLGYQHTVEDSVYLHPDHCGKGLGRKLLQAVFDRLGKEYKVVIAKMSILPKQAPEENASCRLHMAMGFRVVGRLENVGFKLDTLVDVIILQLDLER